MAGSYTTDKIRNVVFLGHSGCGKTSLAEAMLFNTGATTRMGRVEDGNTISDYDEEEIHRTMSLNLSVIPCEWEGHKINILDAPGYADFQGEMLNGLHVADTAIIIIDASAGVEVGTQLTWQMAVESKKSIAIFVNKMDREVREPLDLIDEIERTLGMSTVPFTWPVGMGKNFHGVCDLQNDSMRVFQPGSDRVTDEEVIAHFDNPSLHTRFGNDLSDALQAIDLIRGASPAFDHEEFLAGKQTPVFFGSAINNFGVREILDALVDLAPPPESRNAIQREVFPDEQKFSGMVFKIQANMNLAHRDRIAFVRICSGHFKRGMNLKVARSGKDIRTSTVVSFLSQRRDILEEGYPGDIIGIPNHGTLQLGDTLTEGEVYH